MNEWILFFFKLIDDFYNLVELLMDVLLLLLNNLKSRIREIGNILLFKERECIENKFDCIGEGFGFERLDGYESELIDVSSDSFNFRNCYCLCDEIEIGMNYVFFFLDDINKWYIFDFL